MNGIETALVQMLADRFTRRQRIALRSEIFFSALAALLVGAGAIYLLMALRGWLNEYYTMPLASLLTGLAAFVLAGLSLALVVFAAKEEKPAPALHDDLAHALAQISADAEAPIAANPRTSVLLAGLAGYMMGGRLH